MYIVEHGCTKLKCVHFLYTVAEKVTGLMRMNVVASDTHSAHTTA